MVNSRARLTDFTLSRFYTWHNESSLPVYIRYVFLLKQNIYISLYKNSKETILITQLIIYLQRFQPVCWPCHITTIIHVTPWLYWLYILTTWRISSSTYTIYIYSNLFMPNTVRKFLSSNYSHTQAQLSLKNSTLFIVLVETQLLYRIRDQGPYISLSFAITRTVSESLSLTPYPRSNRICPSLSLSLSIFRCISDWPIGLHHETTFLVYFYVLLNSHYVFCPVFTTRVTATNLRHVEQICRNFNLYYLRVWFLLTSDSYITFLCMVCPTCTCTTFLWYQWFYFWKQQPATIRLSFENQDLYTTCSENKQLHYRKIGNKKNSNFVPAMYAYTIPSLHCWK